MNHIYLDYAATTPLDPAVFDAMKPYFTEQFHNPSGVYSAALLVKSALHDAREGTARALSARPQEIIFCDGGTEANNLAIRGAILAWKEKHPNQKPHIITSSIEHSSVLELCKELEYNNECTVDYLPVDASGTIDPKELKKRITENTVVVSISYANGEVGVIQDVKEIAKVVRHYKKHNATMYPYFHTDAAQATSFCNTNVLQLGVDLMTITGSKIYGPKKIAALFVKTGVNLKPLLYGGEQESSLRPGTENIPYIVGFAAALQRAQELKDKELARLTSLKEYFIRELSTLDPSIIINSNHPHAQYLPNIVNITVPELSSEEIVLRLDAKGIACSMKSACTNTTDGDSHVILALRANDETNRAHTGSIRFSFGRGTAKEELQTTFTELTSVITRIREFKSTLDSN